MDEVTPLPTHGSVFFDPRDQGRTLRVSFHPASSMFVVSLWRDEECLGTFRLPSVDVPRLVHGLVAPLAGSGSQLGRDAESDSA
jgi:hypothetical protein